VRRTGTHSLAASAGAVAPNCCRASSFHQTLTTAGFGWHRPQILSAVSASKNGLGAPVLQLFPTRVWLLRFSKLRCMAVWHTANLRFPLQC
jgi:hypothetical protein